MSFFALPPEINSLLMFSGAGSGPMLEAATAWNGLASELGTAAQSFASVTSGLAGQAWQGAAAKAMAAAAAPYAGWLSSAAAQASGAAAQAQAVASSFESALAATVHPLAVQANRNGLVQLVMSNLFGQNAPAIAATEAFYEEMWAQDVTAMVGYHGGAAAAAGQLTSGLPQALQSLPMLPGIPMGGMGGIGSAGGGTTGGSNVGGANPGSSAGDNSVGSANAGGSGSGYANLGFPTATGYINSGNMVDNSVGSANTVANTGVADPGSNSVMSGNGGNVGTGSVGGGFAGLGGVAEQKQMPMRGSFGCASG